MERAYKNTDEIMDYLKVVPVFDSSGLRLDVYLDGRKVGRIDEHTKEIELDVKVAEKENSNMDSIGKPDRDCSYYDTLCKEYGGNYYCSYAPKICKNFPDIDNWSDCVAECLQNFEQKYGCGNESNNNDKSPRWTDACTKDAHAFCWTSCISGDPNKPPFPAPPYRGPRRRK